VPPILHVIPEVKPRPEVKIDLDDRVYLFPAGKPVIQLVLLAEGREIHFDAFFLLINLERRPASRR
jgi:hypothetical protein